MIECLGGLMVTLMEKLVRERETKRGVGVRVGG